ncbi:MAG: DUF2442 domain-containing protein [Balneola sp.]|jgi:hypothetical protein
MITLEKNSAEVTNISSHGIWLFHNKKEYFLSYKEFPWFKSATIEEVLNVETPSKTHFYWPDLDVDLSLDSIENPDKYPLISDL